MGAGSGHGDQLLVLDFLYIHLTLILGVRVTLTEEQGLNSLCTEGHLGQDTADILNLLSSFFFFTSIFFPVFALWLINLIRNEPSDRAKDVFLCQ